MAVATCVQKCVVSKLLRVSSLGSVTKAVSLRPMPSAMEVCVWLDNRNSTMFLMTCTNILLIIYKSTHTLTPIYENTARWLVSMYRIPGVESPG